MRSIVGRFLEHSRMFVFTNGGEREVYIGSADWMGRNLDRRVETVVPVLDPILGDMICDDILDVLPRATTSKRACCAPTARYERRAVLPGEPRVDISANLPQALPGRLTRAFYGEGDSLRVTIVFHS